MIFQAHDLTYDCAASFVPGSVIPDQTAVEMIEPASARTLVLINADRGSDAYRGEADSSVSIRLGECIVIMRSLIGRVLGLATT